MDIINDGILMMLPICKILKNIANKTIQHVLSLKKAERVQNIFVDVVDGTSEISKIKIVFFI